ncbi:MAG: PQQ-binding-like beta-propeller repeat protein, partial [Anaerolineales bacterium]
LGASSVNSPALDDNGILYIGTFNSELLAVDSKLGKIIWHLNTNDWVWGSPTLGPDNTLFVTDLGGNLYAVDTEAGKFLWEKEVDAETSIAGSVLIVNDSLFVVTSNGAIVSYGLDGERLWKENIGSEDNPVEFYGTPILAGEDLILVSSTGSDNLVYAFNTQLETQWTFEPGK